MNKEAISVTLTPDNLLWLRGQLRAIGARSVSEVLDRLVSQVRFAGGLSDTTPRSVKGTIEISADDSGLEHADVVIRDLFPRRLDSRTRRRASGKSG